MINIFNWVESLLSFFTFNFGGGGGGPQNSTQTGTTTTSNVPEYMRPFFEESQKQGAKNVYNTDSSGAVTGVKGMPLYTGQRVAGFTPEQTSAQTNIAGLTQPGGFGIAQTGLGTGTTMGYQAGLQGLNQAFGYNPNNAQTFGQTQANQYMSPYQQNVTDIALREARQQGDIQRQQGALGSIGRGTFGGARQALMQAEQGRNLNRQLSDIQAQGSQQGYQNAQQQFNADAQRQQQAQQFGAGLGQQLGTAGLQAGLQGSQQTGAMAAAQQTSDLQRLMAQSTSGAEKQALQQKIDDIQYQTAMEARDYEKKQIEFYNAILRGNVGLGSTQINYAPPPSTAAQLGGLGLGALGISKAFS
jgi:hypothetical protein